MFDSRITIFTGHYGSGKSEVAINYVKQMQRWMESKEARESQELKGPQGLQGSQESRESQAPRGSDAIHASKIPVIVDLDIVNPYFRTSDVKAQLEKEGIKVIAPVFANSNVDVPALTGEVNMIFENKNVQAVIDVGGDDSGAIALGRYHEEITAEPYELLMVVNTFRPFTNTKERILEMLNDIESACRLKVTGIVGNTNLLKQTTKEIIIDGTKIIIKAAEEAGVPVKFITGFAPHITEAGEILGLQYMEIEKNINLVF